MRVSGLQLLYADSFRGYICYGIAKIEKKTIKDVTKSDAIAQATGKKKTSKGKKKRTVENIAYYKIPVDFEITGNFLGYI